MATAQPESTLSAEEEVKKLLPKFLKDVSFFEKPFGKEYTKEEVKEWKKKNPKFKIGVIAMNKASKMVYVGTSSECFEQYNLKEDYKESSLGEVEYVGEVQDGSPAASSASPGSAPPAAAASSASSSAASASPAPAPAAAASAAPAGSPASPTGSSASPAPAAAVAIPKTFPGVDPFASLTSQQLQAYVTDAKGLLPMYTSDPKNTLNINDILQHIYDRFIQIYIFLASNKANRVRIAGDPKKNKHALGVGIAVQSWGGRPQHQTIVNTIQSYASAIQKQFSKQFEYGVVGNQRGDTPSVEEKIDGDANIQQPHPSATMWHVWGANEHNWNKSQGEDLAGRGQASYFNYQQPGVFGIITMPITDPNLIKVTINEPFNKTPATQKGGGADGKPTVTVINDGVADDTTLTGFKTKTLFNAIPAAKRFSDHAYVEYKSNAIGTFNIAQEVNSKSTIQAANFFVHKFPANVPTQLQPNTQYPNAAIEKPGEYDQRLTNILQFCEQQLKTVDIIALQETPGETKIKQLLTKNNIDIGVLTDKNFDTMFLFKKSLNIQLIKYQQTPPHASGFTNADTALTPSFGEEASDIRRSTLINDITNKRLIMSIHAKGIDTKRTPQRRLALFRLMQKIVDEYSSNYANYSFLFIGDFNVSLVPTNETEKQDIENLVKGNVEIHTTPENESFSYSDHNFGVSKGGNIDLLIKFLPLPPLSNSNLQNIKAKGFNLSKNFPITQLKRQPETYMTLSQFDKNFLAWMDRDKVPNAEKRKELQRSLFRVVFGRKKIKDLNDFHTKLILSYTELEPYDMIPCTPDEQMREDFSKSLAYRLDDVAERFLRYVLTLGTKENIHVQKLDRYARFLRRMLDSLKNEGTACFEYKDDPSMKPDKDLSLEQMLDQENYTRLLKIINSFVRDQKQKNPSYTYEQLREEMMQLGKDKVTGDGKALYDELVGFLKSLTTEEETNDLNRLIVFLSEVLMQTINNYEILRRLERIICRLEQGRATEVDKQVLAGIQAMPGIQDLQEKAEELKESFKGNQPITDLLNLLTGNPGKISLDDILKEIQTELGKTPGASDQSTRIEELEASLEKAGTDHEAERKRLEAQIAAVNAELEESQERLRKLESENQRLTAERDQAIEAAREEERARCAGLEALRDQLKRDLQTAREGRASAEDATEQARAGQRDAEAGRAAAEEQAAAAGEQLREAEAAREAAYGELRDARAAQAAAEARAQAADGQVRDARAAQAEAEARAGQAEAEAAAAGQRQRAAEGRIATAEEAAQEARAALTAATQQGGQEQAQVAQQLAAAQRELGQARTEAEAARTALAAAEEAVAAARGEAEAARGQAEAARGQAEAARGQVEAARGQVEAAAAAQAASQAAAEAARRETTTQTAARTQAEEALAAARRNTTQAQEALEQARRQAQTELEQLRRTVQQGEEGAAARLAEAERRAAARIRAAEEAQTAAAAQAQAAQESAQAERGRREIAEGALRDMQGTLDGLRRQIADLTQQMSEQARASTAAVPPPAAREPPSLPSAAEEESTQAQAQAQAQGQSLLQQASALSTPRQPPPRVPQPLTTGTRFDLGGRIDDARTRRDEQLIREAYEAQQRRLHPFGSPSAQPKGIPQGKIPSATPARWQTSVSAAPGGINAAANPPAGVASLGSGAAPMKPGVRTPTAFGSGAARGAGGAFSQRGGGRSQPICETMLTLLLLFLRNSSPEADPQEFLDKAGATLDDLGQCPLVLHVLNELIDISEEAKTNSKKGMNFKKVVSEEISPEFMNRLENSYNSRFNNEEKELLANFSHPLTLYSRPPEEFEEILGANPYLLSNEDVHTDDEEDTPLNGLDEDNIAVTKEERESISNGGVSLGGLLLLYLTCLRDLQQAGESPSLNSKCQLPMPKRTVERAKTPKRQRSSSKGSTTRSKQSTQRIQL